MPGVEPIQGAQPPEHNDVLVVSFAASQAEPEWLGVPCLPQVSDSVLRFGMFHVELGPGHFPGDLPVP